MKCEKRGGWAIQEFSNMPVRISEGQKKNGKVYWSENFLSGGIIQIPLFSIKHNTMFLANIGKYTYNENIKKTYIYVSFNKDR